MEEPAAKVFNLCRTVNCIAVYGITMSKAGTLPRQKPCHITDKKGQYRFFLPRKKVDRKLLKDVLRIQALSNMLVSPTADWYPFKKYKNQMQITNREK